MKPRLLPLSAAVACALFWVAWANPAAGQATYPKIEASFTVTNAISNPFDYTIADVEVQITQPDSTVITLPAFFDGGTTWRVRHTPTQSGTYFVGAIALNGANINVGNLTPANWTVSGFPTNAGFLKVDPSNPRRFLTGDGRRFFPVGENVAWDSGSHTVTSIFPKMGAAHLNWSRVWMDHWDGKNLDWNNNGSSPGPLGVLSLTVAQKWDAIVAAADQNGIHFQMTLQHHGQYSTTVDSNWGQNPYNTTNAASTIGFLTDPVAFFTDPTARAVTKLKLRYIVARWGYSPAIVWELFNEVQFTDAGQTGQWSLIQAWHDEMAQFIRSQDRYHHLITTSSDLTKPIWDQTDYYQHHEYPTDLISGIRDSQDISGSQPVAPDFPGECGIDFTAHVGVSPPVWSGLMCAQSGGAQPWYWDTFIDANNDYFLIQAVADFVTRSGLADQNALTKISPQTTGGLTALQFAPGGGWGANQGPDTFTVGPTIPDGIGLSTPYLQGQYHRDYLTNGYTFFVNYATSGTFSSQILQIASSGATFQMFLDGALKTNIAFPSTSSDTSTNVTFTIPISTGAHTVKLYNSGLDWMVLGNITLSPYAPLLGAYAVGNTNFQALWIWHRTNVFRATPGPSVTGTVAISSLAQGTYSATWWDTFGAGVISNFTLTVPTPGATVTVTTPAVSRSTALYIGIAAQAGVTPPNLSPTVLTNSPRFIEPLVITNSGGLPLSYWITYSGSLPSWLSLSGTNGYVSASGSVSLSLVFNPVGLAPGTYSFTLTLNTSDPALPSMPLPISLTVRTSLIPAVPVLQFLSNSPFTFRLQGDPGVAYVLQSSSDLALWNPVSTNTIPVSPGYLDFSPATGPVPAQQFWRALWQP